MSEVDRKIIALRVEIYQPQAHYRIPFTYQRRHTFPIPPYSVIKGFLCNVLGILSGIQNVDDDERLKKLRLLQIAIAGRFENKTTEYIWFRNLYKKNHEERYGYMSNRFIHGEVCHIGGQQPILIDILNDVHLVIHLIHESREFLNEIMNALNNPIKRTQPLHLGRAEDWIVLKNKVIEVQLNLEKVYGAYNYFFWIPMEFENAEGLPYRVPSFYFIKGNLRNFEYINVFLNDGKVKGLNCYYDDVLNLPIFPARFTGEAKNEQTLRQKF